MVLVIRRSALSPQPTDVIAATFAESDVERGGGAVKRKRKRRRTPGGLGRGLARILTDSQAEPELRSEGQAGLLQLVGAQSTVRASRVRSFVVDSALATLAEAFQLDGVVLATQPPAVNDLEAEHRTPTFLAATLPDGWSTDSQPLFAIYGELWRLLRHDESKGQHLTTVGGHTVWMSRVAGAVQPVVTMAIRRAPLTPAEMEILGPVLASVVLACSEDEERVVARQIISRDTAASLKSEGADVLAEVTADWPLGPDSEMVDALPRRTGVGRAGDPVLAVARAAAKACRPRCEVTFAGASEMEGSEVSIVMIRTADNGLRLGYAVRQQGDYSGAAEAVFTAAGAMPAS